MNIKDVVIIVILTIFSIDSFLLSSRAYSHFLIRSLSLTHTHTRARAHTNTRTLFLNLSSIENIQFYLVGRLEIEELFV